ncbi:MAG: hypothetical protein ACQCN5_02880 [Candidatus Bathyarchaeia archaeon]|jgi:hypothetical protein
MSYGTIESKFLRVFLIMVAVICIFGGPTYFALILNEVLGVGFSVAVTLGFIVFLVGVADLLFLIRKKVVT